MRNKKDKKVKIQEDLDKPSRCLGLCDREYKVVDENGKPIIYCHGCGRDLGKLFG